MIHARSFGVMLAQRAISSSVRWQPMQKPSDATAHTPTHGVRIGCLGIDGHMVCSK